jgi:hypothetical protein
MTTQTENKGHDLANNLMAQLGLFAVVVAIVIAMAWRYVW